MLNNEEAKTYWSKPLPERFHIFMVNEICSEEEYQIGIKRKNYNYLPLLQAMKEDMPGLFFAYFKDLLHEEEYEDFNDELHKMVFGKV